MEEEHINIDELKALADKYKKQRNVVEHTTSNIPKKRMKKSKNTIKRLKN